MLNDSNSDVAVLEDKKLLTFQIVKVIAGILLIFFLPLEYLISDSLNHIEKSSMISIQNHRNHTSVQFFKALTYCGNHVFLIVVFPIMYHFYDARKSMKITLVVCVAMYIYSFLALIYVEPRPFWVTSDITGEICQSGFGEPALEVMLVTVLFVYTVTELVRGRRLIEQISAYAGCLTLSTLFVTSALYLGEHFPHQVIVTLCFSFIYLTSAFALDKYIKSLALKCCFGYNENRKNSVYCFIAVMAMFLAIVSTNSLVTDKKGIDIYWIKHALEHCSSHYQVNGSQSFYVSAWIFYMQGAVFGCMFSAKRLSMFWWMTSYWKRALRTIIAVGFSLGFYTLFGLFSFNNDSSNYLFNYVLPLLIISFTVHGIMPVAFAKVHLALNISPDVDDETELTNYFGGL